MCRETGQWGLKEWTVKIKDVSGGLANMSKYVYECYLHRRYLRDRGVSVEKYSKVELENLVEAAERQNIGLEHFEGRLSFRRIENEVTILQMSLKGDALSLKTMMSIGFTGESGERRLPSVSSPCAKATLHTKYPQFHLLKGTAALNTSIVLAQVATSFIDLRKYPTFIDLCCFRRAICKQDHAFSSL